MGGLSVSLSTVGLATCAAVPVYTRPLESSLLPSPGLRVLYREDDMDVPAQGMER
jgi:hypothetical protein